MVWVEVKDPVQTPKVKGTVRHMSPNLVTVILLGVNLSNQRAGGVSLGAMTLWRDASRCI